MGRRSTDWLPTIWEEAFDKGKHERVVANTVFVFDEAGVLREIQFE